MDATVAHWDDVYRRAPTELSWYQAQPTVSLELIDALGVGPECSVVDVGGGASVLAGALLDRGFRDLTVLDVSPAALATARAQLTQRAELVSFETGDVRSWRPGRTFDLWHDRAVLHFLVDEADRGRYAETLRTSVGPGGSAIIATFAPDGPDRCSGLPVQRYDAAAVSRLLGPDFELATERREDATTPRGVVQRFCWAALRRRGA